jgi:hypothetical protein
MRSAAFACTMGAAVEADGDRSRGGTALTCETSGTRELSGPSR